MRSTRYAQVRSIIVSRSCERYNPSRAQSLTWVTKAHEWSRSVLRSFSVVGALAAAALALVIGIFAFSTHSKPDHPPAGGGPNQSGVADHPVAAAQNAPQQSPAQLQMQLQEQLREQRQSPAGPPAGGGFFSSSASGFGASGGSSPAPVRSCSPGLISGLLAAVGGLLGGSGSAC